MGVFTFESEATFMIPPTKVFMAFVLESDTHIPEVIPQSIQSIKILEGNGRPRSIKKISFGQGKSKKHFNNVIFHRFVKHKIESLDTKNLTYCYTIIERDAIGESIKKVENEINILASTDGGYMVKSTNKYYSKGDYEVKEDHIKAGKKKGLGLFRAMEKYVSKHPDYN